MSDEERKGCNWLFYNKNVFHCVADPQVTIQPQRKKAFRIKGNNLVHNTTTLFATIKIKSTFMLVKYLVIVICKITQVELWNSRVLDMYKQN